MNLTKEEKKEIKKLHKTGRISTKSKNSITRKALFQLVWKEDYGDYKSCFGNRHETIDHFNKKGFLNKKQPFFNYKEMELMLIKDDMECKKRSKIEGYTKYKIALFDPNTFNFLFSVRCDIGPFCKRDTLEESMLYGLCSNASLREN